MHRLINCMLLKLDANSCKINAGDTHIEEKKNENCHAAGRNISSKNLPDIIQISKRSQIH